MEERPTTAGPKDRIDDGLSLLIDLIPDAVAVLVDSHIAHANANANRMFRVSPPDSLIGRHVLDLLDESSRHLALSRIDAPPQSDLARPYHLRRLTGESFEGEITSRRLDFRGQNALLLVVRDISERLRIHDLSLQTGRLASLGEMAAGLIHEMLQPLNVIRMAAEGAQLLFERGRTTPKWQNEQFALITDQCRRATEIVDEIRVFSRRDTGPARPFDAARSARAAAEMLRTQIEGDGLTLALAGMDSGAMVIGRRIQLEQAVMNLITNARHALGEARSLGATSGTIRLTTDASATEVMIEIEDDGPGIPPPLRTRIFEPFFTTKPAGQGTGLGLSVSFGVITAMGGGLTLIDSPRGARFRISLPLCPDA